MSGLGGLMIFRAHTPARARERERESREKEDGIEEKEGKRQLTLFISLLLQTH